MLTDCMMEHPKINKRPLNKTQDVLYTCANMMGNNKTVLSSYGQCIARLTTAPSGGNNRPCRCPAQCDKTQTIMSYSVNGAHKRCKHGNKLSANSSLIKCNSNHSNTIASEEPTKQAAGAFRDLLLLTLSYTKCGASTVAIDNKIEQAMDLVKSHLMFAVREEVLVLKDQIKELVEKNNQLEYENNLLRASATPETLSKLSQTPGQTQSSQPS